MSETKKFGKLGMFFITTFALTYGMGILLYAVYRVGGEVSVFATGQTFYPAAGAIAAILAAPIEPFYYSPDTWGLSILAQLITCVSLGIFFAYAYMKTENIWVPVFLHFMNNNLIPVITGIYSADVVQNNIIHIQDVLISLVINGGDVWKLFAVQAVSQLTAPVI